MRVETKFTPGPWQFYADTPSVDPNWHIVTNASRMRVLANVHIEPGNPMDLANARLIAAAPELFATSEALLEKIGHICGIETERRALIAAINKAVSA
jgi:hypothetical protein